MFIFYRLDGFSWMVSPEECFGISETGSTVFHVGKGRVCFPRGFQAPAMQQRSRSLTFAQLGIES
jgi:hypothetical protein